ncbi:MAG TPA: aminotransferase class V-fold PLP-dependent enzyme [Stellaceae bacterium]|nr:aminotransferase class V-fold PLP-dependent enzyme [Stellaceae bacterium]
MTKAITYGAALKCEWPLDPAVTYLNHGGYGVAPHPVLRAQAEWRARIERNPTRFMRRELAPAQREAGSRLAAFLGASGDDLVFVDNATAGINAVLRSLDLGHGDEILVTSLAYGAVAKAARYVAERSGARLREVAIPLPLSDVGAVVDAVAAALSPRVRLALFDHIASMSALTLPAAELTALAKTAGARVLIDGAHAPGQIALDLPAIGADWYVGNCHKWLMAPRGAGFLWAAPEAQALVHPLAISHGFGQSFHAEFDWTGTRDFTSFLCIPAGIDFHTALGGAALVARNAALAAEAAQLLVARWGTRTLAPASLFAAMVPVQLPLADAPTIETAIALERRLSDEHRIEAAIMAQADGLWVRLAAQAYNEIGDYERLAAVF